MCISVFLFIYVSICEILIVTCCTVLFSRVIMSTHDSDVHTISPELPAMFDGMKLAAVATVLYIVVRCLNLKSATAPPDLTYQDTAINRFLLKSCPQLTKE